jgi:hypothetical protein
VEIEDLDARVRGIERAFQLVGAGHLALETARAFLRIDVERFLQRALPNLRGSPSSASLDSDVKQLNYRAQLPEVIGKIRSPMPKKA